jgi:hypothetical protein
MNSSEALKVQTYLRGLFNKSGIGLRPREDDISEDSCEVTMDGDFMGVIFKDTEDGEVCYHLQMTILEEDLT